MRIPLKHYSGLLGNYLKPHWPKVFLLTALLLGGIGARTFNPQVLRYFIDAAKGNSDSSGFITSLLDFVGANASNQLLTAALLFMGVAILNQVISVTARYIGELVGWLSTNALREDLTLHCLRLNMSFHNAHTPGDMIERIDGDLSNLANFFSRFIIQVLANIVLLIAVLVILFYEEWRVGLAMTGYAIVTLTSLTLIRNIAVPAWKEARDASSDLFGFLEEHLSGTEDIRSSGATGFAMRWLHKFTRARLQKELKGGMMNVLMWMVTGTMYSIGQAIAISLGYYLFNRGVFTVGTVFMVIHYADSLFRPLWQITREMEDFQKASASMVRIQELHTIENSITDGEGVRFPSGPLAVEFDNVTFGYNSEETVLQDISFRLEPGVVLGLLGRTGSGKTTITRLLFRLYDANKGRIRLGDMNIRDAKLRDLRHHVGMVTQNVQLFRATVRDNLTFFDANVGDDRILDVIQEVGLWSWYESLSNGLDTELQSSGGGLSAGEAQLLTFTRVFLKDPGLVVLDEASSRLDPATEQLIERAVDRLLKNRTAIIIAHRLATVERADEIMILEDGRICEYGNRTALANDSSSRLSKLLQTGIQVEPSEISTIREVLA
ncbi:ABC transporter ATP-binding protein [Candidatus Poribacteria bacterium]|nr:ABC transporter ATP-binding protein [Candidatus Poribacteria bacterium]